MNPQTNPTSPIHDTNNSFLHRTKHQTPLNDTSQQAIDPQLYLYLQPIHTKKITCTALNYTHQSRLLQIQPALTVLSSHPYNILSYGRTQGELGSPSYSWWYNESSPNLSIDYHYSMTPLL
jgi:hypothetical protein